MIKKRKILNMAYKGVKKTIMSSKERSDKSKHADTIIRNHIIFSMGASFIPFPVADMLAVSALQLDMIRQLCRVYDIDFSETQGKAIITALSGPILAKAGARSIIKLVPGIGTLIGGVTISIFNGASTYALGEVFKKHFESGGTILDFDSERLKKTFKEKFEKGKKVAKQMKEEEEAKKKAKASTSEEVEIEVVDAEEEKSGDVIEKLKELGDLKEKGIISDAEFKRLKKKLIGDA